MVLPYSYQYTSDTMPDETFGAALNSMDTLTEKWGSGRREVFFWHEALLKQVVGGNL